MRKLASRSLSAEPVKKPRIRVALVEDREELRANLAPIIRLAPVFELVACYPDGESALAGIPVALPNVVLMDINLPGLDGVECVRQLKAKLPETQFVMLTVYEDANRLFQSLQAGASGYLLKRTTPEKLLAAITDVCEGAVPMTPEMARRVIRHFQESPAPQEEMRGLTPRETEVLQQLARGLRYKEVEDNLGISAGTLRTYIASIYRKLHVHSRTEAVVKFLNP